MKSNAKRSSGVVAGLMGYLSETRQTNILPEVADQLQRMLKESTDVSEIKVASFIQLTSQQKTLLKKTINNLTGLDLPVINAVDKNLLGGFTVRVGDWFLDTSLQFLLKNLKAGLLQ